VSAARSPIEEVRRRLARLGSAARAHGVAPVGARARAPERPAAPIRRPSLSLPVEIRRAGRPGAEARRRVSAAPHAEARAAEAALGPARAVAVPVGEIAPRAVPAPRLGARAGRVSPLAPATARRGSRDGRLRVLCRERIPWTLLPRERLAAAWTRLLREHRADPADLRLVGVYGPVPLAAIEGVALDGDGRLRLRLGRRAAPAGTGDVALARHAVTGRLLRSDVPAK
jgi:hypothetical protein